jgi:hypothetical protein
MLLGNMGTEKRFRKRGLSYFIRDICIGLARMLSKRVGCRYVYLRTAKNKIQYYKKLGFIPSEKISESGKLWMYRRIIPKHVSRSLSDSVEISDKVTRLKASARGLYEHVSVSDSVSAVVNKTDKKD